MREEFAYAEKANDERAAIEREACLAPQGETWNVLVRQEGSLDRSIERKVRILPRLREESASQAAAPAGEDGGARTENVGDAGSGESGNAELVEAVENTKMKDQSANVAEKKAPHFENRPESGNVLENRDGHAHSAGMSLKRREGVIASQAPSGALFGATI